MKLRYLLGVLPAILVLAVAVRAASPLVKTASGGPNPNWSATATVNYTRTEVSDPDRVQYDIGESTLTMSGDVSTTVFYRALLWTAGGATHWETSAQSGEGWYSHNIQGDSGDLFPLVKVTPPPDPSIEWLENEWFETTPTATVNFKIQAGLENEQIDDWAEGTLN